MSVTEATVVVEHVGVGPDAVAYQDGWDLQRATHEHVVDGGPDTVLLLEHQAVYTAGRRTEDAERPLDSTPSTSARSSASPAPRWRGEAASGFRPTRTDLIARSQRSAFA